VGAGASSPNPKRVGLQVIDRGKQGTRPIPGRSRYTKLLVGKEGKRR